MTLRTLHFTLCTLHPILYTYTPNSTLYILLFTLHFTLDTPHSTLCTSHLTLDTPHCTLHTPQPELTLDTLHSTWYTSHSTLYSILCTPHSTLDTPPPTLYTAHFPRHNLHLTLYTSHCTLYAPHSTLHSPHSTLQTLYFHALLHFRPSQLCPFHTLRCMEPWPSFISMLRAHTPTSPPQLPFFTALLLLTLPKVHSDAEGGPFNLPQSLVIILAMLNFFIIFVQHPMSATVRTHMFSSSSPPTYIASIRRFGLDVDLTNMPQLQTCSSTLTKKSGQLRCALCVFMRRSLPS